jgi:hypothetical protein
MKFKALKTKWTLEQKQTVLDMFRDGHNIDEVAEAIGFTDINPIKKFIDNHNCASPDNERTYLSDRRYDKEPVTARKHNSDLEFGKLLFNGGYIPESVLVSAELVLAARGKK